MRRVIASEFVSLDVVMESPEKWHFPYFNDEMGEEIGVAMAAADTMLLGRVTYEEWATFWPTQSSDDEIAGYMNNIRKFVCLDYPGHGRVAELDADQGQCRGRDHQAEAAAR